MKTDLFQSCGHCWVFQICWHIECSTFTASSFNIWNSSTGIPSPPLALFVVMLSKAHSLHIPGCLALGEWSHHRDYLGHEDLFCTVLLCILAIFLISSASVRSIPFLSFYRAHLCMKCSIGISDFLEEISSLPFCCFPLFLCIDYRGGLSYLFLLFFETLQSDAYIFPFLICILFLFFSQLFERPPQTAILLFCISFLWGWSWSLSPVQCHEPHSIVSSSLNVW